MTGTSSALASALADRYVIERELGSGGMATVYLAEDLKHHRQVAIKVLKPELAAALGAERFLREIEVTAGLTHPHILPLHDSGEADGFLYYVMPYVAGDPLRGRLERETQLPIDEALRITQHIADVYALAELKDEALDWLGNALSRGWINYPFTVLHDPLFAPLREDPRFEAIATQMKQEWEEFEA